MINETILHIISIRYSTIETEKFKQIVEIKTYIKEIKDNTMYALIRNRTFNEEYLFR